jgi:hypothetical protein
LIEIKHRAQKASLRDKYPIKNNRHPARHGLLDESLLTQMPPFSMLTTDHIRAILDQATSRRNDAGVAVIEEGFDA